MLMLRCCQVYCLNHLFPVFEAHVGLSKTGNMADLSLLPSDFKGFQILYIIFILAPSLSLLVRQLFTYLICNRRHLIM